jgi:hypothetical protein
MLKVCVYPSYKFTVRGALTLKADEAAPASAVGLSEHSVVNIEPDRQLLNTNNLVSF